MWALQVAVAPQQQRQLSHSEPSPLGTPLPPTSPGQQRRQTACWASRLHQHWRLRRWPSPSGLQPPRFLTNHADLMTAVVCQVRLPCRNTCHCTCAGRRKPSQRGPARQRGRRLCRCQQPSACLHWLWQLVRAASLFFRHQLRRRQLCLWRLVGCSRCPRPGNKKMWPLCACHRLPMCCPA